MTANNKILYTSHGRTALTDTGGDGPVLVLLHGMGASKEVFEHQINSPLAHMHRLIAIDLPGHGGSERSKDPEKDCTIPATADLIAEVLEMRGVKRAVVLGWSLGGHIAIQMMAAYPELLSGVVLSGTPPISHGVWASLRGFHVTFGSLLGSKIKLTQRDAEKFAHLCYGDRTTPELVNTLLASDGYTRAAIARSSVRGDGPDQAIIMGTSPIPVAVVNGSDDQLLRLKYVENFAYANLWEKRCHKIANAGHAAFMSAPNTFNQLLNRFITDVNIKERDETPVVAAPVARRA